MTTRLTLDALEVLDSIERKGSFAAAAAALYRVPSAVTYTVNKLEQELGVTVFRKEGRRSVLTPAGEMLLEQGRELLEAAARLVETTRQVDSGWESCLNIAIDSVYTFEVIGEHLKALYQLNPEIEVNLQEEVLGGAWEAVLDGRSDLVIGAIAPSGSTQGIRHEEIGRCQWCFAVAGSHPLAESVGVVEEQEIRQYRGAVVRDSSRHLPALTRRVFDAQAVLRVQTIEQKISAQLAGLAVGFLPRHRIAAHLESGALVALQLAEPEVDSPLYLVWRKGARGKALRWMLERLIT